MKRARIAVAFSAPLQNSEGKTEGEINAVCIATQPSPGHAVGPATR